MKKNLTAPHTPCPCQSGQAYGECCGVWHHGIDESVHATTPEALMRSRYSAYVLGLLDYLLKTWHPATAPGDLELFPTKWLSLEVKSTASTGDAGVVEFVAARSMARPSACMKPAALCGCTMRWGSAGCISMGISTRIDLPFVPARSSSNCD